MAWSISPSLSSLSQVARSQGIHGVQFQALSSLTSNRPSSIHPQFSNDFLFSRLQEWRGLSHTMHIKVSPYLLCSVTDLLILALSATKISRQGRLSCNQSPQSSLWIGRELIPVPHFVNTVCTTHVSSTCFLKRWWCQRARIWAHIYYYYSSSQFLVSMLTSLPKPGGSLFILDHVI